MMSIKINTNDDDTSMSIQSIMIMIIITYRHVTDDDTDASIQLVTMMIIKNHTIDDDANDASKGSEVDTSINLVHNNVGTIFQAQHQNDSSHDQALLIANRIYKPTIMSQITN